MSDDDDLSNELDSAEKRAHHNALERKRRDHIKDSFSSLKDTVPSLQSEKVASRSLILKKASDFIIFMKQKNVGHQQDINDLKRQNTILEAQIRTLERARVTGDYTIESNELTLNISESESSDESDKELQKSKKRKKM